MCPLTFVVLLFTVFLVVAVSPAQQVSTKGTDHIQIVQNYGTLPLAFEANQGKADAK